MARGLLHRSVAPETASAPSPLSSQQNGRQLAHSTTIVGSGTSQRRALQTAVSNSAGLTSALANTAIARIVLASGTYYLSAELSITRSVVLEAAVAGSVILNAQASSSSPRRVLNINPGSSGVVQLIGLHITGGYIVDSGGGVSVYSGTVTITSSWITGNTATWAMGLCSNCYGGGGGVFINGGTVTFSSCTITGNTAGFGWAGGGVRVQGGTVAFTSCTITGNTAGSGGGVFVQSSTVTITSSSITGNLATAERPYGQSGICGNCGGGRLGHAGCTSQLLESAPCAEHQPGLVGHCGADRARHHQRIRAQHGGRWYLGPIRLSQIERMPLYLQPSYLYSNRI